MLECNFSFKICLIDCAGYMLAHQMDIRRYGDTILWVLKCFFFTQILCKYCGEILANRKNFPWKLYGNSRSNCGGILEGEQAVWRIGGGISNVSHSQLGSFADNFPTIHFLIIIFIITTPYLPLSHIIIFITGSLVASCLFYLLGVQGIWTMQSYCLWLLFVLWKHQNQHKEHKKDSALGIVW